MYMDHEHRCYSFGSFDECLYSYTRSALDHDDRGSFLVISKGMAL